jgi:hypothetical protein
MSRTSLPVVVSCANPKCKGKQVHNGPVPVVIKTNKDDSHCRHCGKRATRKNPKAHDHLAWHCPINGYWAYKRGGKLICENNCDNKPNCKHLGNKVYSKSQLAEA